ncbi:MAG: glucose-1-phosphate thymidylyltransferase [Candidatus Hinthialibacter antarcticus]|nr:glucose-1-phosphate thymidylyltransferase [Candidatus Hinthialibacter antarcticus]
MTKLKAIIPCAGRGKRLRPLTFTNSKPLIPIANKPLVLYAIEKLKRVGVEEIGIVVSDNTHDMADVIGDGSAFDVKISYIQQDKPLGIAHTIMVSQEFLGDSPFIMYLGDNLLQEGLEGAVSKFEQCKDGAVICLREVDKPELFGIALMENDRVVKLVEKPKDPPTNLAAIGIYVFSPNIHKITKNLKPSARGEYEITDAIQGLIDGDYPVGHQVLAGWWIDAGNPDDMIEANRLVLSDIEQPCNKGTVDDGSDVRGDVVIGEGSKIERSTIRGPVVIGKNCFIRDAFVGSFTSIGDGSRLLDCEVEYSVIMEHCHISNVDERIDHSILGRNVTISCSERRPRSYKLVLSDESEAILR